ncbi:MAG: hypothetical protein EBU08_11285 [Micrococcales bacterium]|nr:hypothetical protein [Micrococcales bacterium]
MTQPEFIKDNDGIVMTYGLMCLEVDRRIFKLAPNSADQLMLELLATRTLQYENQTRTAYLFSAPMKEDVPHLRPFVKRGMIGRCYEPSAITHQPLGDDWICSVDGDILASPRPVLELFYRPPSIIQQAISFGSAIKKATSDGTLATKVRPETFAMRKEICVGCEYYDPTAFLGTGRCRVCGCGIGKLHMPSQSCPKGKWGKEE